MSRLTLRLPESLHRQLHTLAEREAVSLNQYIVFALTRQATVAYTVQPVTDETRAEQKIAFAQLLNNLGAASDAEIKATLAQRQRATRENKAAYATKSKRTAARKRRTATSSKK